MPQVVWRVLPPQTRAAPPGISISRTDGCASADGLGDRGPDRQTLDQLFAGLPHRSSSRARTSRQVYTARHDPPVEDQRHRSAHVEMVAAELLDEPAGPAADRSNTRVDVPGTQVLTSQRGGQAAAAAHARSKLFAAPGPSRSRPRCSRIGALIEAVGVVQRGVPIPARWRPPNLRPTRADGDRWAAPWCVGSRPVSASAADRGCPARRRACRAAAPPRWAG